MKCGVKVGGWVGTCVDGMMVGGGGCVVGRMRVVAGVWRMCSGWVVWCVAWAVGGASSHQERQKV